eukprot:g65109.t1
MGAGFLLGTKMTHPVPKWRPWEKPADANVANCLITTHKRRFLFLCQNEYYFAQPSWHVNIYRCLRYRVERLAHVKYSIRNYMFPRWNGVRNKLHILNASLTKASLLVQMVCWPTFCWWLCFCAPLFSFAAPQSITVLVNPGAWRRSFSSNWQPTTDSRLHSTDAWVAGAVDGAQWLTIDLGRPAQLQGIVTQGRSGYQQYVQSYRVELSLLGDSFAAVEGGRVLAGNGDAESAATALLARPVQARFVRLVPHTWHNWISLRAALLLVVELDDSGSRLNFSSVLPQPGQSGSQLGRLHSALAWSASSSSGEWALLELGGLYLVYGLATQGHAQQQQ